MRKVNVLITGGGAPGIVGTIHALLFNEDKRPIRIVTVDAREDVVGRYFSDAFYKIPKTNDDRFIENILKICEIEKIDVIIPQVTRELMVFAENAHLFHKRGIKITIMDKNILKIVNNKYLLLKEFSKLGYKQGQFKLIRSKNELLQFAKDIGYPEKRFVVKLPVSNGMRGLRIVTSEQLSLEKFINEKPSGEFANLESILQLFEQGELELLAMEYFPGKEYTVDVYRSPLTKEVIVIPRSRDVIRTGITFEGRLIKDKNMIKMAKDLAKNLDMIYTFGFQFKLDEHGAPHLLECNPRVQGTMIMSVLGGANMIYWAVKEALGEPVNLKNVNIKWGLVFKRYWGGIAIHDGETQKILENC